jgi:hypothetical protein
MPQADNRFFNRSETSDGYDCFLGDWEAADGSVRKISFPSKFFIDRMDCYFPRFVAKPYSTSAPFIE